MKEKVKKVVLAYSGGLDTSVILKWLIETYDCEVVAFAANLGQAEELTGLKEKGRKTGASKVYVEDLREEFVRDFIFPMVRANAIYEGGYLMGTSIARPLIAKHQMMRFELTYLAFDPHIKIIAPWKIWDFKSRTDLVRYARKHGIPVPVTAAKPYSSDRNLFHISFEGGILEDPWKAPPENMFILSVSPEKAPNRPTHVEIEFHRGNPVGVNGKRMSPARLLTELNRLGGKNGIGRVDIVENRYVGMKSRGVYETPGWTILHAAHRAVESITMDREVMHIRDSLVSRYAEMVYYGYWFTPEREVLQKMMDEAQATVSGTARIKLFKGNCIVEGRKSGESLYSADFATFEEDQVYNQKDAEGFIRLNALRLRIRALQREKRKG